MNTSDYSNKKYGKYEFPSQDSFSAQVTYLSHRTSQEKQFDLYQNCTFIYIFEVTHHTVQSVW